MQARHTQALIWAVATAALSLVACGEVTQSASDCNRGEYFDLSNELCRSCPALEVPECPENCGVELVPDDRSCLSAVCACDLCQEGEFYDPDLSLCQSCPDAEALTCGPGCQQVGSSLDDRGCTVPACDCDQPAPEAECPEVQQPDCGDEGCCQVIVEEDEQGCPMPSCQCPEEAPEGFYFEDDGPRCLRCPDEGGPEACQSES